MNFRKLWTALLLLSGLIEALIALGCWFAPARALEAFRLGGVPAFELSFLSVVLGWLFWMITVLCGWAAWLIQRGQDEVAQQITVILGAWWVGIGATLAIVFSRPEHWALDCAKGALLIYFAKKGAITRPKSNLRP